MKRIITLFTVISLVLSVSACSLTDTNIESASVGDSKVTVISNAEFSYQIRATYSNLCSLVDQYEQIIGYNPLGFKVDVSPDEQKYAPESESGDNSGLSYNTWMEYIADTAVCAIQERKALCAEAEDAGIKLDNDDIKRINDLIEEMKENLLADSTGLTFENILKQTYGDDMTYEIFRKIQEEATLAEKFEKITTEDYYNSYSDSDIEKIYEKNKSEYCVVDIGVCSMKFTTKNRADVKKEAEQILSSISDKASFKKLINESGNNDASVLNSISSSDLESVDSLGLIKDWAFDSQRKKGDKKIIEANDSFFVVYLITPLYDTYAYNSRHILLKIKDTENVSDADWYTLLSEAESIVDKWRKSGATEERFAELAKRYSTDSGSKANGGLYENIEPGTFVSEYEDWCLDPARKKGDVELVKVIAPNYQGYHIIYFISVSDTPVWQNKIRTEKSEEDYLNYSTDIFKTECYKYTLDSETFNYCVADSLARIKESIKHKSSAD